ncbi:hypothetical protein GCM10009742_27190 [Kribbella karoonensis]|uniref:Uncharacterized protein n=1 Tax=Kribbella karoonensis TaxID=324851 RepID=A0ABN2DRI6_9ACTN
MRSWLVREVFPGEDVEGNELSAIERAVHQTVYHVSGTCGIGVAERAADLILASIRNREASTAAAS